MRPIEQYRCIVFDCDGVVLDSNRIKTEAFFQAALPYGEHNASMLVEFHRRHGGVSRYKKFEYFLEEIVAGEPTEKALEALLESYASLAYQGLLSCDVAPGLRSFRAAFPDVRWIIASGGDEQELRQVFSIRGLSDLFDGGIFGSPVPKDAILAREMKSGNLLTPALFIGDSRFDHQCAETAALDFVFISEWSEFDDWPAYCGQHGIPVFNNIYGMLTEVLKGQ